MQFSEAKLPGVFIIDLEKIRDERGFFARALCHREFEAQGLTDDFVQANLSFNQKKFTLRGMHYQEAPYDEVKLVRCSKGKLLDVVIDLRPASPTHLNWMAQELDAERHTMIYIPKGFAHGYLTLADATEVFYQVSQYYTPDAEKGIRWDDPLFHIEWPQRKGLIISAKDLAWPDYRADKEVRHPNSRRE